MKGLDFKDWMKIASDNKSTTLQHKKGHVMTIAHSALPKIQQEQLKRLKMADGGSVDDVPEPNKKNAQDFSKGASESGTPSISEAYTNLKKGLGYAEGGSVDSWTKREDNEKGINKGHAGMHIKNGEGHPDSIGAAKLSHQKVLKEMKEMPKPKLYAEGGEATSAEDSPDQIKQDAAQSAPTVVINTGNAAPAPQVPSAIQAAPRYAGDSRQVEVPQTPQPQMSSATQGLPARQNIANQGQQAVEQEVPIKAAAAGMNAQLLDTYNKQEQAKLDDNQAYMQKAALAAKTMDNYVQQNPIQKPGLFENKNVPQKIAGAIGLLLGGFQGGFNGTGVNPALEYLKDQQAKDIQAQKDRMDQQKTVYGAYHQLFGDDVIASNLASVTYNNMLARGFDQTAAKLGTAQAQQAGMAAKAELNKDNMQKLGVIGQRMGALKRGEAQPIGLNGKPIQKVSASMEKQAGNNQKNEINPDINILKPDAENKYNDLKFSHPEWTPEQIGKASEQYTRVKQVEPVLQSIPEIYSKLEGNITPGGALSRSLTPDIAGPIGEALGPAVGAITAAPGQILSGLTDAENWVAKKTGLKNTDHDEPVETQTNQNELYKGAQDRITTDFVNSLGGKVPYEVVHRIVMNNSPGYLDSPKVRAARLENMIKELRQSVPTDALEAAGMARKR